MKRAPWILLALAFAVGAITGLAYIYRCPTEFLKADPKSWLAFECNGKPIHPLHLKTIADELEKPQYAGLRMELATILNFLRLGTGRHPRIQVQDVGAPPCIATRETVQYRDVAVFGDGYFQYKLLGVTSKGTHVIRTEVSYGGSGIFTDLLFIRLEESRGGLWLKCTGDLVLGDRDDSPVTVTGDTVTVGPSGQRSTPVVIAVD